MRVLDLLANTSLELTLRSASSDRLLSRSVQGCAVTEMMDPVPYLSRGELMVTTGMGLHFTDPRIWDAYVERLAEVPVAALAFRLGPVHRKIPDGLLAACERHDVVLLELPADMPRLQLSRHIWQELAAERYAVVRDGWKLADECMRTAAEGGMLRDLIDKVAAMMGARVSLVDPKGYVLASAAPSARTDQDDRAGQVDRSEAEVAGPRDARPGGTSTTSVALPGAETPFRLRIEGLSESMLLMPLLGPVCGVIAMQLAYTLTSRSPLHSQAMAHLMTALINDTVRDPEEIRTLAAEVGFDPGESWTIVEVDAAAQTSGANLRHVSWQLRVRLEALFDVVRFFEEPTRTTLLAQGAAAQADLPAALEQTVEDAGVGAQFASDVDLDVLPLVLRLARRVPFTPGVHSVPGLDLETIATGLPNPGILALARRMLAPLRVADSSGELEHTLLTYLEANGKAPVVCQKLFIHRNTLAYRMRQIQRLLDMDLDDGGTRATCLFALRILGPRVPAQQTTSK